MIRPRLCPAFREAVLLLLPCAEGLPPVRRCGSAPGEYWMVVVITADHFLRVPFTDSRTLSPVPDAEQFPILGVMNRISRGCPGSVTVETPYWSASLCHQRTSRSCFALPVSSYRSGMRQEPSNRTWNPLSWLPPVAGVTPISRFISAASRPSRFHDLDRAIPHLSETNADDLIRSWEIAVAIQRQAPLLCHLSKQFLRSGVPPEIILTRDSVQRK